MKIHYFAGLSAAGIILLNSQSSLAFRIIPSSPGATFRYQPTSPYSFRGERWQTEVSNDVWAQRLPRGGTLLFKNTLRFLWAPRATPPLGQGWSFRSADRDLEGYFEIKTYYACAFREACGGPTGVGPEANNPNRPNRLTTGVGAVFSLKYHPAGSDPTPANNNLHWIQVVRSNRSFLPFVDNGSKFDNPYYDTPNSYLAGRDFFIDRPYFYSPNSARSPNFFSADLYLVEEITPPGTTRRQVKIYNGIRWGWSNKKIPRDVCPAKSISGECPPPPPPPPPPPCNGGSGGGGCLRTNQYENTDQELPLFERDGVDAASISRDTLEETELASDQRDFSDTEPSSSNSDDFNLFEDTFASSYSDDETDWFDNEDVSFFDFNGTQLEDSELAYLFNSDSDQSSKSVPEPSSVLGLLALGVGGVLHSLKNRLGRKQ